MKRGWWRLKWNSVGDGDEEVTELNDSDREHIGDMIKQGFIEGEIVQEDNEEEE